MKFEEDQVDLELYAKKSSGSIDLNDDDIALILAAGHGKRIRSSLPKIAHQVWGKPSVTRVLEAINQGFKTQNEVIVVGRKADEIINLLGPRKHRIFAFQKEQLGTGDAVREGVKRIPAKYQGNLFVLPGDVGLIDHKTLALYKRRFNRSQAAMMLLTGIFEGDSKENYFGRVIRVPEFDANSNLSPEEDLHKVIAIVQYQDILNLSDKKPLSLTYRGRKYLFSKKELLNIQEFDSAIFAFKLPLLGQYLTKLSDQKNVQKEFYLTDLVEIFSQAGLGVESVTPFNHHEVLLGFNDKNVWRQIEKAYRKRYFDQLKNIVDIEDEDRFFIDESLIKQLIVMDRKGPLDIFIGSGAHISKGVKISRKVSIGAETKLLGNIVLEEGVELGPQIKISTLADQKVKIRSKAKLAGRNVIKGEVEIQKNVFIAESVNITGSNRFPSIIGKGASLLGSCYFFGTKVAPAAIIESSILIKKKVACKRSKQGEIQPIKFILPPPIGTELLEDLTDQ